jgi:quaternary ammonium compound-resistance protein SugE
MAWVYLLAAGIFEVIWAVAMKYCDGFKLGVPLFLLLISMVFSIFFLSLAVKTLPMSVAYAVWTSIGIVGVFTFGVLVLKEPVSLLSLIAVGLILTGIVILKLQTK